MRRRILEKSKKWITDTGRTINAQFSKDITQMIKTGYFPLILFFTVFLTSIILYDGQNVNSSFNSYMKVSESLKHNILHIVFEPFISTFLILLLIAPAISITDDIENKSFDVFRAYKINITGYYIGKILSSLFFVILLMSTVGYIGEGALLYDGYQFTSGFFIDPVIVALAFVPPLIVGFSLMLFISAIMPNKILSVMILLFAEFLGQYITSALEANLRASGIVFNFFYDLIGGMQNVSFSILGYNYITDANLKESVSSLLYTSLEFAFIFLALGFIFLIIRRHYAYVIGKIKKMLKINLNRGVRDYE